MRHRNDDSKKPPKGRWFGPQPAAVSSPQLELAWGQEEGREILGPVGHTADTGSAARCPEEEHVINRTWVRKLHTPLSTPFLPFAACPPLKQPSPPSPACCSWGASATGHSSLRGPPCLSPQGLPCSPLRGKRQDSANILGSQVLPQK